MHWGKRSIGMLNDKIKALSSKHGEISAATLHLAAMLFMLMDHLWATLLPAQDWLTCVGRLSCFCLYGGRRLFSHAQL